MEWIKEYWYIILLGLFAAMFIFGHRSNRSEGGKVDDHQHGAHTEGKANKGSRSCCH
jgi:hypothetical protein